MHADSSHLTVPSGPHLLVGELKEGECKAEGPEYCMNSVQTFLKQASAHDGGHQKNAARDAQAKRLFKQASVGHGVIRYRPRMPTNLERKLQDAREALCKRMRGNKNASNMMSSSIWDSKASDINSEKLPDQVNAMQAGTNSWVPSAGGCKKQPSLHKPCVMRTRPVRTPMQASSCNQSRNKDMSCKGTAGSDSPIQTSTKGQPGSLAIDSPSHASNAAAGSTDAAILAACNLPYKQSHLSILPTCTQQWEQDKTLFYNPIGPLAGIAPHQFTGTLRKGLMMFFSPLKTQEALKKWELTDALLQGELETQAEESATEQQKLDGTSEADGNLVERRINCLAARLGLHPLHIWHLLQLGAETSQEHASSQQHSTHASATAALRQSAVKKHLLQKSEIDASGRAFIPSAWPQYLREKSPNARIKAALQGASHASHTLNGTPLGSVKLRDTPQGAPQESDATNAAVECPDSPNHTSSFMLQSNLSMQPINHPAHSPTSHLPTLSVQRQSSNLKAAGASLTPRQSASLQPRQSLTAAKPLSMRLSLQLSRMQSSNELPTPRNRAPFSAEGRSLSQRYLSAAHNNEWNPNELGSIRPGMDSLWEHQAGVYDIELANLLQQLEQERKTAKLQLPFTPQQEHHEVTVNLITPRQLSSRTTQLPQSPQLPRQDPSQQQNNVGFALPSSRSVPWPEQTVPAHATARHPIFRDSNHAIPAAKARHMAGSPEGGYVSDSALIPPPTRPEDVRQTLGRSLIRQMMQQQANKTCHLFPDPSRHNLFVAKPSNHDGQPGHRVCDVQPDGRQSDTEVADARVLEVIQHLARAFGVSLDESSEHSSTHDGANASSLSKELCKLHLTVGVQPDVWSTNQQSNKDRPDSPVEVHAAKQQSIGYTRLKRVMPLLKYRTSKQTAPMIELQSKTFAASRAVINYLQDAQYTRHMLWAAEKQLTPLKLKQISKQAHIPLEV